MQERTHRAARAGRRAMAEASVVNGARMQELRFHKKLAARWSKYGMDCGTPAARAVRWSPGLVRPPAVCRATAPVPRRKALAQSALPDTCRRYTLAPTPSGQAPPHTFQS
eukprot:scaffold128448_cov24-Phaeocystis_antarctica.AAC.1